MSDNKEEEPLSKNFYVKVGVIFITIVVLYFVISPLQNCMRDIPSWKTKDSMKIFCVNRTSW